MLTKLLKNKYPLVASLHYLVSQYFRTQVQILFVRYIPVIFPHYTPPSNMQILQVKARTQILTFSSK